MKFATSWVKPPNAIGGLDHLGTQGPCVLIYAKLLPGITNVTDRARYYSLYPWLIWSFDQRFPEADAKLFIDYYRRADCLLTLIAARHARLLGEAEELHGSAMVGRNQLLPALERLESEQSRLRLTDYAAAEGGTRYFKNPMGGLGQYYAGTLASLQLLDPSGRPWIKYTHEQGAPLAECVNRFVDHEHFWSCVESDEVTLTDLDALVSFCPCGLSESPEEHAFLSNLFFDEQGIYDDLGAQRKKTLALVLHLADAWGADSEYAFDMDAFRCAIYTHTLPGDKVWTVPASLAQTAEGWCTYQRNDLLSMAMQALFSCALSLFEDAGISQRLALSSVESFSASVVKLDEVSDALGQLHVATFGELAMRQLRKGRLPIHWEDEAHEINLLHEIVRQITQGDMSTLRFAELFRVFSMLWMRGKEQASAHAYGQLAFTDDELSASPINLSSFQLRCERWGAMRLADVLQDALTWILNTHLTVALRKLRQTSQSTFRFRPTEMGLRLVDQVPMPSQTTPRIRQALHILLDLGALCRAGEDEGFGIRLTDFGRQRMETACD
jgi:hypothetical protein